MCDEVADPLELANRIVDVLTPFCLVYVKKNHQYRTVYKLI